MNINQIKRNSIKVKPKLKLLTWVLTIGTLAGAIATINFQSSYSTQTVKAASKKDIDEFKNLHVSPKTFPKKMRGTWYSCSSDDNSLTKTVITKNKMIYRYKNGKVTNSLHVYKKHSLNPKSKGYRRNRISWLFLNYVKPFKEKNRYYVVYRGWNQVLGTNVHYNVSKINGHEILTLSSGFYVSDHSYKSKKLALKYKQKHYHNFIYHKIAMD